MNYKLFYDKVRSDLFSGKISQGIVDTINAIIESCERNHVTELEYIAYILATGKHEAYHIKYNPDWHPVREGYAMTNQGAIRAVTNLFNSKKISKNYALPLANGFSYYGRGWVQITHYYNYVSVGKRLGIDLANNPDLALKRDVAADIIVIGMKEGIFTGKRLSNYFNSKIKDPLNARRIINGIDQQEIIAGMYEKFLSALKLAQ